GAAAAHLPAESVWRLAGWAGGLAQEHILLWHLRGDTAEVRDQRCGHRALAGGSRRRFHGTERHLRPALVDLRRAYAVPGKQDSGEPAGWNRAEVPGAIRAAAQLEQLRWQLSRRDA